MSWFTNLRILAFVRRAVRALESLAESQRTLASLAQEEWNAKHAPKVIRRAVFSQLDQREANSRYRRQQAERMVAAVADEPPAWEDEL
jgi:hypothetical protein